MQIVKCEVTKDNVVVALENGVTINMSFNPGCLHLSFSGVCVSHEDGVVASPSAHHFDLKGMKFSNYLDLKYKPTKEL